MARTQLSGKYVPDKNGKLKPVLKLNEINISPPATVSRYPDSPALSKIWRWIKSRIL
ncbi:MAG: hypothetical protein K6U74_19945 [Firmicutes bacterium]|nr:hypothetical protein [Bacillota bacterium]